MDERDLVGPTAAASLAAHAVTATIEPDVDGRTGVVIEDKVQLVELSEAFGDPLVIAAKLEAAAAVMLARAAALKRPPVPENPRPGDLGVPAHWT